MRKLNFLFCLLVLLVFNMPTNVNAQSYLSQYYDMRRGINHTDTLDYAKLQITYSLSYIQNTATPEKITKDRKILLIGDKISKFYSYYVNQSDSTLTADHKQNKNSAPIKRPPDIQGEGYDIYTNYPAKDKRTVVEPITNLSLYKYKEPMEVLQWVITGESEVILGYPCIKATTRLRGRDYEAWFTMNIPVNLGPWKLGGLPGLILRACDTNKHYVFECIGIEQLNQKLPIEMPQWKCIETTREAYRKTQKHYHNDYVNFLSTLGITIMLLDDDGKLSGKTIETSNNYYSNRNFSYSMGIYIRDRYKKVPYNPIELE